MGILTNIIAAEEDEVEAIGESLQPLDEWSGIALRDLTIPRIVMLHCLLTGDLFDDAFILYEPIYLSAAEEPWCCVWRRGRWRAWRILMKKPWRPWQTN